MTTVGPSRVGSSLDYAMDRFHNMEPKHEMDVPPLPKRVGMMRRRRARATNARKL